ncbi:hypothetical protein EJB05_11695 [Eragrostis curvula]|uniref:Uncharacterized protein n=1 Tax=Eragrostis curvula TaxID=38414 RepID=A0A5J9VPN7_9POAL|nr:hypothetical protein EJB05_11695 [Eragrostis curvula]
MLFKSPNYSFSDGFKLVVKCPGIFHSPYLLLPLLLSSRRLCFRAVISSFPSSVVVGSSLSMADVVLGARSPGKTDAQMRQEPNPGLNSSSSCLDDGFSPHTGDLGLRCSGFVPDGSGVDDAEGPKKSN